MTTWLSPHFSLEELTASETAARLGLNNAPPAKVREALEATAAKLEAVRALLGKPILINSGYRAPKVNVAVGGSATSHHCKGYAVDFICPGFGRPLEVCRAIAASGIRYDQLIHEFGRWTHLSFAPSMRGQELTIDSRGTRAGLFEARR